jgi:rhomboid protease GluP
MAGRSNAMLCPNCRKLISADEPRCPYCGTVRPGLWGATPALQRVFGARMDLVPGIIGACVVLYVIGLLIDLPGAMQSRGLLSLLSPSGVALYRLGMTGGFATREGRWWTTLTAIYLHGGLLHIFFNMWWVHRLGAEAQEIFGRARFFILFTLTGVAGFVVSNVMGANPSIGASGAIFGLMGAMLAFQRRQHSSWGEIASSPLMQMIVINLLFGLMMSGINNLAHIGGIASGYLIGHRLPSQHERREGRTTQLVALALFALTLAGFALNLLRPLAILARIES